MLRDADVVVAGAGQNSLAEVAACRVPAVVVPAARPHEEQATTAGVLAREGFPAVVVDHLPDDDWTGCSIAPAPWTAPAGPAGATATGRTASPRRPGRGPGRGPGMSPAASPGTDPPRTASVPSPSRTGATRTCAASRPRWPAAPWCPTRWSSWRWVTPTCRSRAAPSSSPSTPTRPTSPWPRPATPRPRRAGPGLRGAGVPRRRLPGRTHPPRDVRRRRRPPTRARSGRARSPTCPRVSTRTRSPTRGGSTRRTRPARARSRRGAHRSGARPVLVAVVRPAPRRLGAGGRLPRGVLRLRRRGHRLRPAGRRRRPRPGWVGGARAYHQHHPTTSPPASTSTTSCATGRCSPPGGAPGRCGLARGVRGRGWSGGRATGG